MKKRGFTLAEVLITLGIVGVVAALTAPALVMSSRNEANAARLSSTVSQLESAFHNAMLSEGVDEFSQTTIAENRNSPRSVIGNLGKYLIVATADYRTPREFYSGSATPSGMASNGSNSNNSVALTELNRNYNNIINLKNGSTVFFKLTGNVTDEATKQLRIRNGSSLYATEGYCIIDVNGKSSPNLIGRDIFLFIIGQNGSLYPRGGADYSVAENAGLWQDNCVDGNIRNEGWECTARVIAEGYKINY